MQPFPLSIPFHSNRCNEPTEFTAVSMFRPPSERDHEKAQSGVASRANLLARGSEQKWANSW